MVFGFLGVGSWVGFLGLGFGLGWILVWSLVGVGLTLVGSSWVGFRFEVSSLDFELEN